MPKTARPIYVRPVKGTFKRVDQGVDYQGTPGDHVVAMGNARIDKVSQDPGGFGQVVYYTLLDGPMAGQQIYVGHARPDVKAGQRVAMGQSVATLTAHGGGNAHNLSGWTEIGFATNNTPSAHGTQDVPGSPGNKFLDFVNGLSTGVPSAAPVSPAAGDVPVQAQGGARLFNTQPSHPADIQANQGVTTGEVGGPQQQLANLWEQIANQSFTSPETAAFAQNSRMSTP